MTLRDPAYVFHVHHYHPSKRLGIFRRWWPQPARRPRASSSSGALCPTRWAACLPPSSNSWPNTSSSTNIAMVGFTGVASRHVTGIAGIIWVVARPDSQRCRDSLSPKPPPVLRRDLIVHGRADHYHRNGPDHTGAADKAQRHHRCHRARLRDGTSLRPAALQALEPGLQMLFKSGLVTGAYAGGAH